MAITRVTRCSPSRLLAATSRSPGTAWLGRPPPGHHDNTTLGSPRAPVVTHVRPDPRKPECGHLPPEVRQRLRVRTAERQHRTQLRRHREHPAHPAHRADRHRVPGRGGGTADGADDRAERRRPRGRPGASGLPFTPIEPGGHDGVDAITVPKGYRVDADPALGRPAVLRLAGVQSGRAGLRGPRAPVRLQQRLPRHPGHRPARAARPAVLQPRVHEPADHVPADRAARPPSARCSRPPWRPPGSAWSNWSAPAGGARGVTFGTAIATGGSPRTRPSC